VELLKKEKASIDRRKKAKENQLESMKRYLLECMKKTKRLKIETPKAKISVKNNQETSRFENEKAFIKMCMEKNLEEYLRYKDPEINKTAVKNALRSGEIVPGAQLERTQSLIIK